MIIRSYKLHKSIRGFSIYRSNGYWGFMIWNRVYTNDETED